MNYVNSLPRFDIDITSLKTNKKREMNLERKKMMRLQKTIKLEKLERKKNPKWIGLTCYLGLEIDITSLKTNKKQKRESQLQSSLC